MKNQSKIKEYLRNSFGWEIEIEDFDIHKNKLPYSLVGSAQYAIINCSGFKAVAIEPRSGVNFRMTRNLASAIEQKIGLPAILILENLDSYQRRCLIDSRINFIVPNKQIYLPALGVYMSERGLGRNHSASDKLSAVATAIIITHLSANTLQGKSISQVAKIMNYSNKTISIAVSELERHRLVSVRQERQKKLLDFTLSPKALWDKTYPMADSPIERKMFTSDKELASEIGIKASDTALSDISLLAAPSQEIYAVYARNPRLKELDLNPYEGTVTIEIWKIDPTLTSANGNTDIFSLALSYKEDDDPRLRKELEQLFNNRL